MCSDGSSCASGGGGGGDAEINAAVSLPFPWFLLVAGLSGSLSLLRASHFLRRFWEAFVGAGEAGCVCVETLLVDEVGGAGGLSRRLADVCGNVGG